MTIFPIAESVVRLRGVERSFRLGKTEVHALRGVDLDVQAGDFLAVAGPSGSGKTTLLNVAGCLDKPDRGTVTVAGRDVTRDTLSKLAPLRNRFFGYVFQTFNLIAVLDAYENVEFPLRLAGVGRAERRRRTEELLVAVGLADHQRHRPNELSGGQRQRVAIARALVTEPLAVLADEPTANLDSKTGSEILDLMSELNRERGVTFVFSTHDQHIISRARRVLWIADGRFEPAALSEPETPPQLAMAGG